MKHPFKLFFLLALVLLPFISGRAGVKEVTNAPDSVYLFSFADANGQSGLKFAWSVDGQSGWRLVGDGYNYVKSDYGPWGAGKKMFRPHLVQEAGGQWHCTWEATASGQVMAHAASADLLKWGRQSYFDAKERASRQPEDLLPTTEGKVSLQGREENGWIQRVPYALVEGLNRYADHRAYRQQLIDERMEQDPVRFAGLTPLKATVTADVSQVKPISEELIGIFFEDINYAADGGLYAELIQNRDFEYLPTDNRRDKEWGPMKAWKAVDAQGEPSESETTCNILTTEPLHPNNPHYLQLSVKRAGAGISNIGFDGIVLHKGEKYDLSLHARTPNGKAVKCVARVVDGQGNVCATSLLSLSGKQWKQRKSTLTATQAVSDGCLQLLLQAEATVDLDFISLFPQKTFKGRKNGLRADLAQTLADLKPRFVRFPGGCVAHGNGIDNIYDWKGSIGALYERKPLRNLWGYHQTRGLGYHEYFLFCEDIGAQPVPVLAAGVPCQNSSICSHHSTGELTCQGQQQGIPMEEMPAYVQDVLDLIEYANGDARHTTWGKKRAQAGHPKPFNLKYIGIGNEDLITDVFEERFRMIYDAVREKYPEITVIGTVGPFFEGTDYDEGWTLAKKLDIPVVDEHYYVAPGWLINNQDYYDRYDRTASKVYLGEYAAHLPGRPNNLETALAEALYLTAVERNADIVTMTSYAPLLAKEGHTQWNPDLIYFNNSEVKPTVGYYTQLLYGQHAGTHYITSQLQVESRRADVKKRVGVSVVKDAHSGDYIVKLANLLPVEVAAEVILDGAELHNPTAVKSVLTGHPADKQASPITEEMSVDGEAFPYVMPPYSFTVIRISSHDTAE
ncbi:MAG: alpha-L-arabinofuranosidase [Bacteroides sp.]|nr:alpha-L-arabinofuranosidase [Bacteroides sp.]